MSSSSSSFPENGMGRFNPSPRSLSGLSHSQEAPCPRAERQPMPSAQGAAKASSRPLSSTDSAATTPLPPQLPSHIEQWSSRALAAWLGVSTSTVKYHARQAFRNHRGRWEFSREQAQKVVNRLFQFGHRETLEKRLSERAHAPATKN